MNTSTPDLVPLQQATLCLDCETITAAHSNCHACGSRALLNIARALDQPGYRTSFVRATRSSPRFFQNTSPA
jgi:hypothetical protein